MRTVVATSQRVGQNGDPVQCNPACLDVVRIARAAGPALRARNRMERSVPQAANRLPCHQTVRRAIDVGQPARLRGTRFRDLLFGKRKQFGKTVTVGGPPVCALQRIEQILRKQSVDAAVVFGRSVRRRRTVGYDIDVCHRTFRTSDCSKNPSACRLAMPKHASSPGASTCNDKVLLAPDLRWKL